MNKNIFFRGEECQVQFSKYSNNRIAILLTEPLTEVRICVATCNLPARTIAPTEVAIKNYSENTGVLDILIDNGIIEPPHRYVTEGFVAIPICHLTSEVIDS